VRIEQTFQVACLPEAVFDYMTNPVNLQDWQTSKTRVEVLSQGEPRAGYRIREWTKVPGRKEFEQVVEFAQFERPRRFDTHIVEGPQPIDGRWVFSPTDRGTVVTFTAAGTLQGLMRLLAPIVTRAIDRQFRAYHENLRRNLESGG
jgi:carbon monoxide dehydrogenase subunit G